MKTVKFIALIAFIATVTFQSNAQTVDEILNNYFENIGGLENWKSLKGIKMEGSVNIGNGMTLPVEMVQLADGKTMVKANFQGQNFYQNVYDGTTLWGTNQMTMAAEKSDAEATENFKNELNDFPSPFIDYQSKGYTVELLGKETMEGTETYKIKLVKEPVLVDGKEEQDISFYYFDTDNFVPIAVEQDMKYGPGKGMTGQTKLSDYQEVEGLYFPFSISEGVKGMPGAQMIVMEKITLNPETEASMFAFPESASTEDKK